MRRGFDDYATFVAILDQGSLTAAAKHLGRSLQAVSRSLALLEEELGATLIRRTTRRLEPTEAGRLLQARLRTALADVEQARAEIAAGASDIAGPLRIGASTLFAATHLVPMLAAFASRYPEVDIDLRLDDAFEDLVAARLDLAIRIGELPSSDLVARRLALLRRVVFAAPGYLDRAGRPAAPADLASHACIVRTAARAAHLWPFRVDGAHVQMRVAGPFRSNGAAACNEAVACGLGIGAAPLWQVRPLVDAGRVELLLTAFEPDPVPVHAVWPRAAAIPARLRTLVDFLAARFAGELF